MTATTLDAVYGNRGVRRGGELYLKPDVAAEFVTSCDEAGMVVVGMEEFELEGESLRPRLDLILDCSRVEASDWEEVRRRCNTTAQDFLRRLRVVNVVVTVEAMSKSDWQDG